MPNFWANAAKLRAESMGYSGPMSATLPENYERPRQDTHTGHRRSLFVAWAECRDDCYARMLAKWLSSPSVHTRRNAEQFRRDHS